MIAQRLRKGIWIVMGCIFVSALIVQAETWSLPLLVVVNAILLLAAIGLDIWVTRQGIDSRESWFGGTPP